MAKHLEYTQLAKSPGNWSERSTFTRILDAEIIDLETIDDPLADALLSLVRDRMASSVVAVVSIETWQGHRSTLIVDSTWLRDAAESLARNPELADGLMLSSHAVIARLPSADGLIASPPRRSDETRVIPNGDDT